MTSTASASTSKPTNSQNHRRARNATFTRSGRQSSPLEPGGRPSKHRHPPVGTDDPSPWIHTIFHTPLSAVGRDGRSQPTSPPHLLGTRGRRWGSTKPRRVSPEPAGATGSSPRTPVHSRRRTRRSPGAEAFGQLAMVTSSDSCSLRTISSCRRRRAARIR